MEIISSTGSSNLVGPSNKDRDEGQRRGGGGGWGGVLGVVSVSWADRKQTSRLDRTTG